MPFSSPKFVRLASINIERSNHLKRVVAFLKKFKPDVFCVQELLEKDVPLLEKELCLHATFLPETKVHLTMEDPVTPLVKEGIAIFTSAPPKAVRTYYYKGDPNVLPIHSKSSDGFVTMNRALLVADVFFGGQIYTFITTHFTWTNHGRVNDEQREHLKKILAFFEREPHFIFCGDLNAPRGREIFNSIASRYKDNIPTRYRTSIDKNLHWAGDLQLMVDGLFSTPQYEVGGVKLSQGVSDHMAVTALVAKRV